MAILVKDLIAKLSELQPDTPIIADVWTPLDINPTGDFDVLEDHWNEILELFVKYSSNAYESAWEAFADAKTDVLINYLCQGCDLYDYTTSEVDGTPLCSYCQEVDK